MNLAHSACPCLEKVQEPSSVICRRKRSGLTLGAVDVQVATAHTRRSYLEHYIAGARRGVGKVAQLELAITDEHDAFHAILPRAFFSTHALMRRAGSSLQRHAGEVSLAAMLGLYN
jgi:hypothetical protein